MLFTEQAALHSTLTKIGIWRYCCMLQKLQHHANNLKQFQKPIKNHAGAALNAKSNSLNRAVTCWQISAVDLSKNDTAEGVEPKQEAHGGKVKSSCSLYKEEINYSWRSSDGGTICNKNWTGRKMFSLSFPLSSSWIETLRCSLPCSKMGVRRRRRR